MKPDTPTADWSILTVRTRSEMEAASLLTEHGLSVYVPQQKRLITPRRAKRQREVLKPAFPSYLFAQVPLDWWYRIRSVKHVSGWLSGPDHKPLAVPDKVLRRLMEREKMGELDDAKLGMRLQPGDLLEVLFGPFAHMDLFYTHMAKDGRIAGEVEFMGAKRKVAVDRNSVKIRDER